MPAKARTPSKDPHFQDSPERHGIKGWGRILGELDEPKTLDQALLTAALASTDLLREISANIITIQARLQRIEIWMEATIPSYQPSYRQALAQPEQPT
jgi:hypothetical protein